MIAISQITLFYHLIIQQKAKYTLPTLDIYEILSSLIKIP